LPEMLAEWKRGGGRGICCCWRWLLEGEGIRASSAWLRGGWRLAASEKPPLVLLCSSAITVREVSLYVAAVCKLTTGGPPANMINNFYIWFCECLEERSGEGEGTSYRMRKLDVST
jgi:hypothetical protein